MNNHSEKLSFGIPRERSVAPEAVLDIVIVSEIRFLRESIAEILTAIPAFSVTGLAATPADALAFSAATGPDIILLDAAITGGPLVAGAFQGFSPPPRLIVIGMGETVENVLAWAEAGIAGYIPNTASIEDLITLIRQISNGEQPCPSQIAGSLLRRLGATPRQASERAPSERKASEPIKLTGRETEIYQLVGAGLSNKDIARRLSISLGTTKTHVHNLLAKLSLQRRAEVTARAHRVSNTGP